jgi:GDP/UDP-N,N'-diacetylbacillosamine 2-epimerase (hydrolysing)
MGEEARRIQVTGAPGLDEVVQTPVMARETFCQRVGLEPDRPFVLVLFHPVVQQAEEALTQTTALIQALQTLNMPVLWLEPNADAGALGVLQALDQQVLPPGSRRWPHLSRPEFLAAMSHAGVMVGNSSAGIIEAASFGTPVVNLGSRQQLRERNTNVQDVSIEVDAMVTAMTQALQHGRYPQGNVYGDGHAAERIAQALLNIPLDKTYLEKANAY